MKIKSPLAVAFVILAGYASGQTITANVNWSAPTGAMATGLHYGMNVFRSYNPAVAGTPGNGTYKTNLNYMQPGLIRQHRNLQQFDSTLYPDGWIQNPNNATYAWDFTKISNALTGSYSYGPVRMMTIVNWPAYLDDGTGKLSTTNFNAFASFCSNLVVLVNGQLGFHVKYWEVTNEKDQVYTTSAEMTQLAAIYKMAAAAMKTADSTIKVGGPAFSWVSTSHCAPFVTNAYQSLDFISYHSYPSGATNETDAQIWNEATNLGPATTDVIQALVATVTNKPIETFLDEYNINYRYAGTNIDLRMTNAKGAVFDALAMISAVTSGTTGSCAWNEADGIFGKLDGSYNKRPAAHLFKLFNTSMAGAVVNSSSGDPSKLVVFATKNGGTNQFVLINRSGAPLTVNLAFSGWEVLLNPTNAFNYGQVSSSGLANGTVTYGTLTNSSGWTLPVDTVTVLTINEVALTFTLTYTAGANGTISGTSPQTVNNGGSGSAVTAVANPNCYFVNWSDGSTANPRTDSNLANDITVTANFMLTVPAGSTLAWDANPATAGPQDGSGTWSTVAPNWLYGTTNTGWPNYNVASFGVNTATNCTVTLANDVTPSNIVFNATGGGSYTIAGTNTIWLTNSTAFTANSNGVITAPINGVGGVVKFGTSILTLNNANTYSGGTTVVAGSLRTSTSQAFGSGALLIKANANVWFNPNETPVNLALLYTNSIIVTNGAALYAGPASFSGTGDASYVAQGPVTNNGPVTLWGTATVGSAAQTPLVFNGQLSGSGTLTVNYVPGAMVSGTAPNSNPGYSLIYLNCTSNNWTGGTVILPSNGQLGYDANAVYAASLGSGPIQLGSPSGNYRTCGRLHLTAANAINPASVVTEYDNHSGFAAQLNLNGYSQTIGGLVSLGANGSAGQYCQVLSASGSPTLTISNTGNYTFNGVISSALSLVKTGSGTQTFTNVQTYTGSTTISGGTLRVNGSLASGSAVTVNASGTLGGSGTVAGPVMVNGTVSPGTNGVGVLNTGAETWNGGGAYTCEINSTNVTGSDRLNIAGALNVQATSGSQFTVKLASLTAGNTPGPLGNFNKATHYTWTLATASGGIVNFDTNKFVLDTTAISNDWSGGTFALAVAGNSLQLNYSVMAAPVVWPVFTGVASSGNGGLQMSGTGAVGQAYVLQATANLAPANWIPIATNVADGNGLFLFNDSTTNAPQQFYRIATP